MTSSDAPCFPPLSKLLAVFFFFIFLPVLKELWGLGHGRVSWGHSTNSSWAEEGGGRRVGKREASGSQGASIRCLEGVWVERKGGCTGEGEII